MKKIFLMLIFLFFISSSIVSAHTGIVNSSPASDEVVNEKLNEIILEFSTKLEPTSLFKVKNITGALIPINVEIIGKKIKGEITEGIDVGEYIVDWSIIGSDGHPVNGTYSFTITGKEKEESLKVIGKIEEKKVTTQSKNAATKKNDIKEVSEPLKEYVNFSIYGTFAIIFLLIVGGFLFIIPMKKKES